MSSLDSQARTSDVLAESVQVLRDLDRDIDLPEARIPKLKAQFEKVLAEADSESLEKLSDIDLLAFFEAAYRVAFYSMEVPYSQQMRRGMDEMERRHIATTTLRQQMLDRYVGSRMLDEAQAYAVDPANAGIEKLPTIRDVSSSRHTATLWKVEDDGASLVRHDFSLGDQARLVVVGSPWCPYSQRASETILADREMSSLMARHSTWIMSQASMPDLSVVEKWNQAHVGWPMQLVYLNSEWPLITSWGTPGFYFLKGGKVVVSFTGWPGSERLRDVRAGFERIGILQPSQGKSAPGAVAE
jgi:hypothetical protein